MFTEAECQTNCNVVDSEMASGIKNIFNGDFRKRVFVAEEASQQEKRFLTGRQDVLIIYEYFKVSDTDESVLYLNEILKLELHNDSR